MKILALTTLYPSPWLPHRASFNRQQFAALAAEHQVHVIAPVSWTDQLRSRAASRSSHFMLRDGMTVEHPRFYFTPGCLRSRHARFYEQSVRSAFDRAVDTMQPDVVLAAWAYPDVSAAVELCGRAGLPLVAKVHGSDVLLPKAGSVRAIQTADALGAASAVVAVSRQLADAVDEMGVPSNRAHIVYNGIDSNLFNPGDRLPPLEHFDKARLLFAGNFVPVKGLDVLIDAAAILRQRGLRFGLDLVGQGPLRKQLEQRIAQLGLRDHVQLCGPQPHHVLAETYRNADLFVLPSRSEGIPNVLLEAVACGMTAVATRVGGVPEILDDRFLVPPDNAGALATAIEARIREPEVPLVPTRSWRDSARALADVLKAASGRQASVAA